MAEIINLRRMRKVKARDTRDRQAERNRIAHGRTKAEKQISQTDRELHERRHDGHKLSDHND